MALPVPDGGSRRRKPRKKPTPRSEAAASGGYQRKKSERYRQSVPYRRALQVGYVEQPVSRRQQILAGPKAATGAQRAVHRARLKKIRQDKAYGQRAGFHDYPMTHTERRGNERFRQTSAYASAVHPEFYKPDYRKRIYEDELRKLQKAGEARARRLNASPTNVAPQSGHGVDTAKLMKKTTDRMIREMTLAGIPAADIAKQIQALSKDTQAPAVPVLRQLTRPVSAIAGGTEALIHGKNVPKAVVQGAVKNDKSFSQVLKGVGAPKWVQHVGGLGLDIALDPTTYVTFGYGAAAKTAARGSLEAARVAGASEAVALRLAREVYDKQVTALGKAAHEAGMTPSQARKVALHPKAAAIVKGSGQTAKGLKVGARGTPVRILTGRREVMTSGTGSAKAVSAVKATGKVLAPKRAAKHAGGADNLARELIFDYKPKGVHPVVHDYERQTGTAYRAARAKGEREAAARVRRVQKMLRREKIPKAREKDIYLAVDAGDLSALSDAEKAVAHRIQIDVREIGEIEQKANLRGELLDAYMPRFRKQDLEVEKPHHVGPLGQRITGTSFERRTGRGPIREMPLEKQGEYHIEDLSLPLARRLIEHGNSMALHKAHQRLGALGQKIDSLDDLTELGGVERAVLFERDAKGFKDLTKDGKLPINTEHDIAKLEAMAKNGRLYVIPRESYDRTLGYMKRGRGSGTDASPLRGFDRLQATQKTLQTVVNPGYHTVNLIGDLFNARLGGVTSGSVARATQLARVMRTLHDLDATLTPKVLKRLEKTETYRGVGGKLSDREVVELAAEHGAIGMGHAGNELQQLLDPTILRRNAVEMLTKGKKSVPVMSGIRAVNELREDFVRLASYHSALKRGLNPEEAAAWVNKHHFDYGDLTPVERNFMRRVIPFYTFFARNTRLQASKLVGRPGPYATFQKTQDEGSRTAGLPTDFVSRLPAYAQAGLPIPLPKKLHGKPLITYPRLPLTDLNNLNPNASLLVQNLLSRSSPLLKVPIEQGTGLNLFFKDRFKKHVPAPGHVLGIPIDDLPGSVKWLLGVHSAYDKASGKMVHSWSWRADELVRQLPQTNLAANISTPQANRHAATPLMALANWALGPKTNTFDALDLRHKQIQTRLSELRDEIPDVASRHRPNREGKVIDRQVDALKKEQGKLENELWQVEKDLGYPKPGGRPPRKGRKRSGIVGTGAGGRLVGSGGAGKLVGS